MGEVTQLDARFVRTPRGRVGSGRGRRGGVAAHPLHALGEGLCVVQAEAVLVVHAVHLLHPLAVHLG